MAEGFDITEALYAMEVAYDETAQFALPYVMTDLTRNYRNIPLRRTQSLMVAAVDMADLEIEELQRLQPTASIAPLNPFKRRDRNNFYAKIEAAIARAGAAQMASAFTTQESTSDR